MTASPIVRSRGATQHRAGRTVSEATPRQVGDRGFTMIELSIAMAIIGTLLGALGMALSLTLQAAPPAERRVDDARATRGLATWLAYDVTSAPPFSPAQAEGGITLGDDPDSNSCSAPGDNLVHLQWREEAALTRVFVANYRFVIDDDEGRIVRFTCERLDAGSFGSTRVVSLSGGLDPASPPEVQLTFSDSLVDSVSFTLRGLDGAAVRVDVSSRNPAESFS